MANYFEQLTPKGKTLVSIIILSVIAVIGFFIVKSVRSYIRKNKEKKNSDEVVKDANIELNNLTAQGQTLSSNPSEYKSSANTIQKLLDGCETFSSEMNVIENIITVVKKPVDFAQLKVDFGTREISVCASFDLKKENYDLPSLLAEQLDSSGFYSLDIAGYKKSGWCFESINVLRDYFSTMGIKI